MAQNFDQSGTPVAEVLNGNVVIGQPSQRPYGSAYPNGAYDAAGGLTRVEQLLTAAMLKKRFLFGVPLFSPLTQEKITTNDLKDYVRRGMNLFEADTKTYIQPVMVRQRLPFDPNLYNQNMWFEFPYKPILRVKRAAICSASYSDFQGGMNPNEVINPDTGQGINPTNPNDGRTPYPSGAQIFTLPNEWIDTSYASHGKIFVNPINPAFSAIGTSSAVAAAGATILTFIGQQGWVPAYWTLECLVGFCSEDGNLPVLVNEAIGQKAAILLLDNLIPLFRIASQSLSLDGMAQSVSDMEYQLLTQKRDKLVEDYKERVKQIKVMTASSMFVSNI